MHLPQLHPILHEATEEQSQRPKLGIVGRAAWRCHSSAWLPAPPPPPGCGRPCSGPPPFSASVAAPERVFRKCCKREVETFGLQNALHEAVVPFPPSQGPALPPQRWSPSLLKFAGASGPDQHRDAAAMPPRSTPRNKHHSEINCAHAHSRSHSLKTLTRNRIPHPQQAVDELLPRVFRVPGPEHHCATRQRVLYAAHRQPVL